MITFCYKDGLRPTSFIAWIGDCVVVLGSGSVDLVVFTVATEATDGYNRFLRSTQLYGLNISVSQR